VNFVAGQVVPNLAFVKLAADGSFTVQNTSPGGTHVVVDVVGYVQAGTVTASGMFVALSPARVLDTRPAYGGSGALAGNEVRVLTVAGLGGVPASGVSGVVMNVTAVATADGYLTLYPANVGIPNASNVNFTAGQVVPNLVAVKTDSAGAVAIRNGSLGATDVIADVSGYFTA
jgi:serine protease